MISDIISINLIEFKNYIIKTDCLTRTSITVYYLIKIKQKMKKD